MRVYPNVQTSQLTDTVEFNCICNRTVEWTFETLKFKDAPLPFNAKEYISEDSQSNKLIISEVTELNLGTYICGFSDPLYRFIAYDTGMLLFMPPNIGRYQIVRADTGYFNIKSIFKYIIVK